MIEYTLWHCKNCGFLFRGPKDKCPRCEMTGATKVSKKMCPVAPAILHPEIKWLRIRKMLRT